MALTAKKENGALSNADRGVVDSLDLLESSYKFFGNGVASGAPLNDSLEMWAQDGKGVEELTGQNLIGR